MKLEEKISEIRKNEELNNLEDIIFNFSVTSSDLLYTPSDDKEYKIKHRLECIIFSTVTHLLFLEAIEPNLFQKIKKDVVMQVSSLIDYTEKINNYTGIDFVISFPGRYKFYGNEISKFPKLNDTLPWKLLSLIYDGPLITDIETFQIETERVDLLTKMPQYINVTTLLKHIKISLQYVLSNLGKEVSDNSKAINSKPEDAVDYYKAGLVNYDKGLYDKAIIDYTKAIEIYPQYVDAYFNRGRVYYYKKLLDQAIADYTKAIEINPKNAESYYFRANAYNDKGLFENAKQDCHKACDLFTQEGDIDGEIAAYSLLGSILP